MRLVLEVLYFRCSLHVTNVAFTLHSDNHCGHAMQQKTYIWITTWPLLCEEVSLARGTIIHSQLLLLPTNKARREISFSVGCSSNIWRGCRWGWQMSFGHVVILWNYTLLNDIDINGDLWFKKLSSSLSLSKILPDINTLLKQIWKFKISDINWS